MPCRLMIGNLGCYSGACLGRRTRRPFRNVLRRSTGRIYSQRMPANPFHCPSARTTRYCGPPYYPVGPYLRDTCIWSTVSLIKARLDMNPEESVIMNSEKNISSRDRRLFLIMGHSHHHLRLDASFLTPPHPTDTSYF
jgi:hypothetical protein